MHIAIIAIAIASYVAKLIHYCSYLLSETCTDKDIAVFAQHHRLQETLHYLSEGNSVGDLPVCLPKVFQHTPCSGGVAYIHFELSHTQFLLCSRAWYIDSYVDNL